MGTAAIFVKASSCLKITDYCVYLKAFMLEFYLDLKINNKTINSMNLVYSLEDFQSNEEIEAIIADLCLDIDMIGEAKFGIFINSYKLFFSWCPTLIYFLTKLPFIINAIDCDTLDEYHIILDPEVNEWILGFCKSTEKGKVIIRFDNKEGEIIKTEIRSQELKEKFNFLLEDFIEIISEIVPAVLEIEILNQWIISSFYKNV